MEFNTWVNGLGMLVQRTANWIMCKLQRMHDKG